MTHAVLDTNVLAAGYAHVTPRSAAVETYGRWLADEYTLVTSEHILDELGRTLRKSYFRLATALSGGASYVVTGDRAFLRVREYRGVRIVTPRQFLNILDAVAEPGVC